MKREQKWKQRAFNGPVMHAAWQVFDDLCGGAVVDEVQTSDPHGTWTWDTGDDFFHACQDVTDLTDFSGLFRSRDDEYEPEWELHFCLRGGSYGFHDFSAEVKGPSAEAIMAVLDPLLDAERNGKFVEWQEDESGLRTITIEHAFTYPEDDEGSADG